MHLVVPDYKVADNEIAFPNQAIGAFPFKIGHVLTGQGLCFTAEGIGRTGQRLSVQHHKARLHTPQINDLVRRFNGRGPHEVLAITIFNLRDLKTMLKDFNQADDT